MKYYRRKRPVSDLKYPDPRISKQKNSVGKVCWGTFPLGQAVKTIEKRTEKERWGFHA